MATTLERGLDVLRAVNGRGHASLHDILSATGLSQERVRHALSELLRLGYLGVDEDGLYTPAARSLQLSAGYHLPRRLAQIAAPPLAALGGQIGWPSHLAVFERDAMAVVLATGGFSISAHNRGVGTRGPMLVSSNGRAYLGFCSAAERAAILARLRTSDNPFDMLARDSAKVDRLLREVRRRGYAMSDASYVKQVYGGVLHGISVPVRLQEQVVAAVNVMFLRKALSLRQGVETLLPLLQAVAARIEADLSQGLGASTVPRMDR